MMKARFPLLLGIVFLASVSVSFGFAYWENERPSYQKCLQSCKLEHDADRQQACLARCKIFRDPECEEPQEEEEPPSHEEKEHGESQRQRGRQEGEKEEKEQQEQDQPRPRPRPRQPHPPQEREHKLQEEPQQEEQDQPWPRPRPQPHQPQPPEEREHKHEEEHDQPSPRPRPHHPQEKEHEEEHQHHQKQQEHEQEEHDQPWPRPRPRPQPHHPQEKEEQEEEHQHHHKEEESEEGQSSESKSQKQKNPFHFRSNRFRTLFNNKHGYIRVLQRFDQRSNKLQNLRNYRIVEYMSKPSTLILPHHSDADFLLVVAEGSAILTFLGPEESKTYTLERGDALRIHAGTTFYMLNRDNNQNLRVIKLAIPVNKPGKFTDFFPSNSEDQESFFRGFSENILEASFDTPLEKIKEVLLGEEKKQEERVIVEVSKEQVRELSKHAKSSSRKTISSEDEPFNLRSRGPIYSNKFGKFFEIPPHKNPQLQDLDIFLSCVEIKEGGLLLPHYNSKAIVVLVVNKGRAKLELVGLKEQQQEQEEEEQEQKEEVKEETRKVQGYRAKLSEGDTFVIPASHPVAINASTDLHLIAFGINAENNQRNFLAGEKDNVIRQMHRQVMELAFPGCGEQLEKLLKKQSESHFADAQPQQSVERKKSRKDRLSSILNAFY